MKRLLVTILTIVLGLTFLSLPSVLEARGGHGGGGFHGGGFHGGFHGGHHDGFHGRVFFGFGAGFWPGYYWGYPYYWGWPYAGWPYSDYVGWPYYPPEATVAPSEYSEPEQQQPYYWYYCQNPQGYYPYVTSCPGGWMAVVPNVSPSSQ